MVVEKNGFRIVENIQKNGFRVGENPGWKHVFNWFHLKKSQNFNVSKLRHPCETVSCKHKLIQFSKVDLFEAPGIPYLLYSCTPKTFFSNLEPPTIYNQELGFKCLERN